MKDFVGLVRDTLKAKNPFGTWHWARNTLLAKGQKSITNEDGLKFQYLIPGTVIGSIVTNYHIVYFFKHETDNIDEVGYVNTNLEIPVYTRVIRDNQFNFNINCPIEGIFVYNYKEELIVSWCDGIYNNSNTPKVLNLFNLPFEVNVDGTLVNPNDFDSVNLVPEKQQGNLEVSYLNGGTIPGYIAYLTFTYVRNDDSNVGYFQSSTIAYLGIAANPVEKKALSLSYTDLDSDFTKLRIGMVIRTEEEDGTPSALLGYESEILNYSGTSLDINIISLNNFTEANPESIILEPANFLKVQTITKAEDRAFVGNVVTKDNNRIPFQKYANLINIIPIQYYEDPETEDEVKRQEVCLMPDEVYANYIELQFLDGTYSPPYHIPGRVAEGTEKDPITAQQKIDFDLDWTDNEVGMKQFHIFNNGYAEAPDNTVPSPPPDESSNKMGYWENLETYPNSEEYNSTEDYEGNPLSGEDLRGTPIRYHRMPSVANMAETEGLVTNPSSTPDGLAGHYEGSASASSTIKRVRKKKLGLRVTNIADVIPAEILSEIQGYRLSHIKRNNGNSYVAGNWCLVRRKDLDVDDNAGDGNGDVDPDNEYYDFNVTITNYTEATGLISYEKVRVLGNELFKFRPILQPTFIQANYKFRINDYVDQNYDDGTNSGTLSTKFSQANEGYVIPDNQRFSKCETPLKYIPGNSPVNNTLNYEEGINLDLKENFLSIDLRDTFPGGTPVSGDDGIVENPYICRLVINATAYLFKLNCYVGFNSDDLNIIGRTGTIQNNTVFKGGDVFNDADMNLNLRSIYRVIYPGVGGSGRSTPRKQFVLPFLLSGLFTPANCTELNNNPPEDRYTKEESIVATYDFDFDVLGKSSLSSIHDINTLLTFDVDDNYTNKFPYRIYRGKKVPNESLSISSLLSYSVGDYFEMPNDKGEIIALRGTKKTLYIQHRYSLFVALIKDSFNIGEELVYLGSSDLFDRLPEEVLPDTKGYIGSTSKFACIIAKGKYITVDQETGQIFIVVGTSGIEISAIGNKNWFWNNWDNGLSFYYNTDNGEKRRIDNPYLSVGHLVGYDKEYNRLLFIKKMYVFKFPEQVDNPQYNVTFDGEFYYANNVPLNFDNKDLFINKSRTLSFSLEENKWRWIAEHDYSPNLIFHTHSNLYSAKNAIDGINRCSIYQHNDKTNKGLFYGTKYESYIDLIFNQSLDITKLLHSISLITDTINNSGGNEDQKTITHIMVYNENQCSGIINIKDNRLTISRHANKEWHINKLRDLVINPTSPILDENGNLIEANINQLTLWFEKSEFISKFISVRLIMDNVDDDSIYIHEVKVNSIKSNR